MQQDQKRLECVIEFANNVLKHGRDRYRDNPTPLFADGIDTATGEHMVWRFPGGRKAVISNLNDQHNLFRVFVLLSALTANDEYKDAAKAAIAYHFEHLQDVSGLLNMGGHRFLDLRTLEVVGPEEKNGVHELKNAFPYYELMFEVNKDCTAKYIEAVWGAHVYDWENLEISRHGAYGHKINDVWEHPYKSPKPFFETKGLSFLNAGNDMIYSAGMLSYYTKNEKPLIWAKRLMNQYVSARHPVTGLGGYQFTQPKKTAETADDNDTNSKYGDRVKRQFREFGDIALEANLLNTNQPDCLYYKNVLMELYLSELLADAGQAFKEATLSGFKAYIKHGYDFETNMMIPMFSDGTDLTDYKFQRNGYNGAAGCCFKRKMASARFFLSAVRAYIASGDEEFWAFAKNVAKFNDLGDIGEAGDMKPKLNFETTQSDAVTIFALLDLYNKYEVEAYLDLAKVIANNIIKYRFHDGYFFKDLETTKVNFNSIDPFAILALHATIVHQKDCVPMFIHGEAGIHGQYEFEDGTVKTIQSGVLY